MMSIKTLLFAALISAVSALEISVQPPKPAWQERKGVSTTLQLRGGGVPLIPLSVAAGGFAVLLKTNAPFREKIMKVLSNVRLDRGGPRLNLKPRKDSKATLTGYDVRNGTWAVEIDEVQPGCLLVSSPETFRFAGSRLVLDQSVVLLVRHGASGSSGFIINRPTQYNVGDVTKKLPMFEQNPLYLGGDIGEGVYMIHGVPGLRNATEVSDGIFYGGSEHAMQLVSEGKAEAKDFRFFFKYVAWAPGQLEAEIQSGCWCPLRSSLDLVLQTRDYKGLSYAKFHKVFWHQVLHTLGGKFLNISRDTIVREEAERLKLEEWVAILQDGGNKTVIQHEGVEMGGLVIATISEKIDPQEMQTVPLTVNQIKDTVQATLTGNESPEVVLKTLSTYFFKEYKTIPGVIDPNGVELHDFINQVLSSKEGSPMALSFLYMAVARELGYPLRVLNCTSRMRSPIDFLVRYDAPVADGEAAQADPIFLDLAAEGSIISKEEAMSKIPGEEEASLGPVPHVQLYSRFMHSYVDSAAKAGDEDSLVLWLQQIRILQAAINTITISHATANQNTTGGVGAPKLQSGEAEQGMTLHEILKDARLVGPGNSTFDASNLKDKYVGIYFSASWCQPCKVFTPQLIQMYSKLKIADGKPFEIVFVSADRSQEAFDGYYGQMPWFAVDFQDGNARSTLSSAIGVEGIPKLALFDTEGRLITGEGRRLVMDDPMGDNFPWTQ